MAIVYTTTDCYNVVCDVLMEPYTSGAAPGLSLGIISQADFIDLFSQVLADFVNRTELVWSIWTQHVVSGTAAVVFPENVNTPKLAFVGGQFIEHSTLADLDDWFLNWQNASGVPDFWYMDEQAPKTVSLAVTPNYTGATYASGSGVYGLFNGATVGVYSGIVSTVGTAVSFVSGNPFDVNWANYSNLAITINTVSYAIASVANAVSLTLTSTAGTQPNVAFSVTVSNDANFTLIGSTGLASITYSLGQVIPVVPDVFCPALAYGVLAKIFSGDSEAKDMARANYANARYLEYVNAAAAVSGAMLSIDG